MRHHRWAIVALAVAACLIQGRAQTRAAGLDRDRYLRDVQYLASDELKGRASGSPELERAAEYIADSFRKAGIKPVGNNGYLQEYQAIIGSTLGRNNRIEVVSQGTTTRVPPTDYASFSFSSSGTLANVPVVFVGYGITAKENNYDDYAGVDVKGKVALMLRHEPQEDDAKSVFNGKETSSHASFANKAVNAKAHGAAGVLLINDTYAHPGTGDAMVKFGTVDGPSDAGILFMQIATAQAEQWLSRDGQSLRTIMESIDHDLKPRSFDLSTRVNMAVEIQKERKTLHNVVAYLPGMTDEYVIVGAHYDHLGLGDSHSLAPSQIGQIHHGADDNASGTAGVLELARYFGKQPKQKRGILFLTFSGEELGLFGSEHYVESPELPLKNAVAMLNMDMIGRIRDGKIYVNGSGTGTTLDALVKSVKAPSSLKIDLSDSIGYGGSDHISFEAKQVPVLFFFSGLHADYHKPSDTADKIDADSAVDLLSYVADLATHLMNDPQRPQFQRIAPKSANPHDGNPGAISSGTSSGYGPNFGSVPDFNEPETGVRFADVRAGTPADKAGLKAGDILTDFDGTKIGNLYDFTYALQAHKPGDEVSVTVLRAKEIEARVQLTASSVAEFGGTPDFKESDGGLRFSTIRSGSPAAQAGLMAGDIVTKFDGAKIADLSDLTKALQSHRPGDSVLVTVVRGTSQIVAKVLLTERR